MLADKIRGMAPLALLLAGSCRAAVNCPDLFQMSPPAPNTYVVLTFVGGDSGTGTREERDRKRSQLEARVSPKMQDYAYRLADKLEATTIPSILLLTCDFAMAAADLNRADAEALSMRNVIAVLWRGQEADGPGVVQLSVPHFQRRTGLMRRQAEVAWLHGFALSGGIDDWVRELDRESVVQQAFLALGIGFMSMRQSQWVLAKRSLCQVRANLKLMARQTVRPPPATLEQELSALIAEALAETDAGARSKGINLDASPQVRLACSP